ncbi:MAG: 2-dehydro-3-deoxygalactonokinase [Opitutaceae bacterium]|nr:2-dehydro-3-deoxygalactonokinase [Opitutaceae bacterium]
MMKSDSYLLSCDWGTSNLRLRLVNRQTGHVESEHCTGEGAQVIAAAHRTQARRRAAFAAALQRGLQALAVTRKPDIPLIISGMACSTLGWHPLPYARLPARLTGADYVKADLRLTGRKVRFISGLRAASDVMRGEECELTGLFMGGARQMPVEGWVMLPGTHSKHVHLRRGRITGFSTHPTGELFTLLSRHSTLCQAIAGDFSPTAFRAGVRAARQQGLGAALFQTRARTVLGLLRPEHGADFLSGVLIGAEIAALPSTGKTMLAAAPNLASRYTMALRTLRPGEDIAVIPPEAMARAVITGHIHLASML